METYTAPKPFEGYSGFQSDRQLASNVLDMTLIDKPLVGLIRDLNALPYLFTLQCCHGHFLTSDGQEITDYDVLGSHNKVKYRLAYIVFCIENSPSGKQFVQHLKNISFTVEQEFVQFCSAKWFWDQWVNSYALQIMPERFKDKDSVVIGLKEAKEIEQARDILFAKMTNLVTTILEKRNVR